MRDREDFYHFTLAHVWSGFAIGMVVNQPHYWEAVALVACAMAAIHVHCVSLT